MAAHRFKSSFGQCQCMWCGQRRNGQDCSVNESIRERVQAFAKLHGRTWKAKLRMLWLQGRDEGDLRNARNMIGPSGLDRITKRMIKVETY